MNVSKTILTVSSVAVAAAFGGGVYLMMNFGSIAKQITERVASETLGVDVSIGNIAVNFQDKAVTVTTVKVGNPAGYSGAYAATIEEIYLKANTLSDVLLRFNDVAVKGSEVYLEVHANATNLTDIKKNVNSKAAQGDRAAEQIKVIIENMRIEKMRVNPQVLAIAGLKVEPITVPDLVLTGVGVKENGVLASEALAQIWAQIAQHVNREANQAGFYEGVSKDALDELGVSHIEQFKERISDDVDALKTDLKGLLKNN